MRKTALVFVLLGGLLGVCDATAQVKSQSVDEFLAKAREHAAVLTEHDAKVDRARWQKFRADWAWGPKVRSDTTFAPVPSNADPDSFGSNVDEFLRLDIGPYVREKLSVVVPVYTFGRIDTAQALAELGLDSARLQKTKALHDVEYQVRRAFYSVQLSAAFHELLGEGGKLIKDKLAEMEEAREFGESDFDTKDLRKLQVFDAELDSRRLDNTRLQSVAEDGLRYFSGHDGAISIAALPEDDELPPLKDVDAYLRQAENSRPDLALLTRAVRARELQLRLERRNLWPNIFVGAEVGLGWSTEDLALTRVCSTAAGGECVDSDELYARPFSNSLNFFTFGIALGMRWDFDFFQSYGKIKEVQAQNDEVLAQQARAKGAIELELRKLWTDADSALKKVAITKRRLEAARRWRDQFGLTLESGGGDMKDAIDPLKAYYEARVLHLQARYEYLVARAALAQAVGVTTLDPLGSE